MSEPALQRVWLAMENGLAWLWAAEHCNTVIARYLDAGGTT